MIRPELGAMLGRLPQLPAPTLGGRHFWADLAITPSHRIQRHVWTGHCRLLDCRDRRRAFGTLERCRTAATRLPHRVAPSGTLIVMLHGLYRSRRCFDRLEQGLRDAAWDVVAPNYPSGHADLRQLGEWLNVLMDGIRGYRRVVFVTYSLGGLVLRSALARSGGWRDRIAVAGIVQIGPPNRGAQAAQVIRRLPPGNRITGPAARLLCEPVDLPEPEASIPLLVIAGGTGRHGFNPLLDGDDDGLVRVAEARPDRPHEFHRLATVHGFLNSHPETGRLVRDAILRWAKPGQDAQGKDASR